MASWREDGAAEASNVSGGTKGWIGLPQNDKYTTAVHKTTVLYCAVMDIDPVHLEAV